MISQLSRYIQYALPYPDLRRLGFPKIGLGIESRNKRLRQHWKNHLAHCLKTQKTWLEYLRSSGSSPTSLMVLGAGRLYDLDVEELVPQFEKIRLIDADPLCFPKWKRLAQKAPKSCQIGGKLEEITEILIPWEKKLRTQINQIDANEINAWDKALAIASAVFSEPGDMPASSFLSASVCRTSGSLALLSLNILSQIPLILQDALENILNEKFSKKFVQEREDQWIKILTPGARRLIEQHLRDLNQSGAASILLITDLEYAHYHAGPRYHRFSQNVPPLVLKNKQWVNNPNLAQNSSPERVEVLGALYGVSDSDLINPGKYFSDYQLLESSEWLWHIAPRGFEQKNLGVMHRVGAFCYSRTNRR